MKMTLEGEIGKFLLKEDKHDSGFWYYYPNDREHAFRILSGWMAKFILADRAKMEKKLEYEKRMRKYGDEFAEKQKSKIEKLETELGKVLKDLAKSEAKNINDSIEIGQLKLKIKNLKKALAGSLTTENVEKWLLNYHNGEGFLIIARCDLRNELRKLNSKKPEPIIKRRKS